MMSIKTKQDIIEAICQTTMENDGKPLGEIRFEKLTGIKPYDWNKFWARYSDAIKEAGFEPNLLTAPYPNDFLSEKIIYLMRKLDKFPTIGEIRLERNINSEFPSNSAFRRFGRTNKELAKKVAEYCKNKNGYEDIIKLCESVLKKSDKSKDL